MSWITRYLVLLCICITSLAIVFIEELTNIRNEILSQTIESIRSTIESRIYVIDYNKTIVPIVSAVSKGKIHLRQNNIHQEDNENNSNSSDNSNNKKEEGEGMELLSQNEISNQIENNQQSFADLTNLLDQGLGNLTDINDSTPTPYPSPSLYPTIFIEPTRIPTSLSTPFPRHGNATDRNFPVLSFLFTVEAITFKKGANSLDSYTINVILLSIIKVINIPRSFIIFQSQSFISNSLAYSIFVTIKISIPLYENTYDVYSSYPQKLYSQFVNNFTIPICCWAELDSAFNELTSTNYTKARLIIGFASVSVTNGLLSYSDITSSPTIIPTNVPQLVSSKESGVGITEIQAIVIAVFLFSIGVSFFLLYLIVKKKWYFADGECLSWISRPERLRRSISAMNTFEMNDVFGYADEYIQGTVTAVNVKPLVESRESSIAQNSFDRRYSGRISFTSERLVNLVEVEPAANVYQPNRHMDDEFNDSSDYSSNY